MSNKNATARFILGLDIGYSNMKMAMGFSGQEISTLLLPVGAATLDKLPQGTNGRDADDVLQVLVGEEKWLAGIEPARLQGWVRVLSENYPSSKQYRALFHAALLLTEQEEVDVLVTGLPVSQFQDEALRHRLAENLTGTHQVTPKRSVTVKEVIVVPQPAGAYMEVVNTANDPELLEVIQDGKTVVLDPGFFSVDWVVLEGGEVRHHSGGTSLKAMSKLLETTDKLIKDDHGASPGYQKIETAIRAGKSDVILLGKKLAIAEYVEKASAVIAEEALTPMRNTMREDGMAADVVLLAGGGASYYESAAKALFPRSRVVKSASPVLSNAIGFWHCA